MKYNYTAWTLWLAQFENAILNSYPSLFDRIDFGMAQHWFFVAQLTPNQAANKYLLNPDNLPENAVRLI